MSVSTRARNALARLGKMNKALDPNDSKHGRQGWDEPGRMQSSEGPLASLMDRYMRDGAFARSLALSRASRSTRSADPLQGPGVGLMPQELSSRILYNVPAEYRAAVAATPWPGGTELEFVEWVGLLRSNLNSMEVDDIDRPGQLIRISRHTAEARAAAGSASSTRPPLRRPLTGRSKAQAAPKRYRSSQWSSSAGSWERQRWGDHWVEPGSWEDWSESNW